MQLRVSSVQVMRSWRQRRLFKSLVKQQRQIISYQEETVTFKIRQPFTIYRYKTIRNNQQQCQDNPLSLFSKVSHRNYEQHHTCRSHRTISYANTICLNKPLTFQKRNATFTMVRRWYGVLPSSRSHSKDNNAGLQLATGGAARQNGRLWSIVNERATWRSVALSQTRFH